MTNQHLKALDPDFDFANCYNTNYCNLKNVKIEPVHIEHEFLVDNVICILTYGSKLYRVVYRDWRNQTWFPLSFGDNEKPLFWSSETNAREWFDHARTQYGFELLSQKKALTMAREHLGLHQM